MGQPLPVAREPVYAVPAVAAEPVMYMADRAYATFGAGYMAAPPQPAYSYAPVEHAYYQPMPPSQYVYVPAPPPQMMVAAHPAHSVPPPGYMHYEMAPAPPCVQATAYAHPTPAGPPGHLVVGHPQQPAAVGAPASAPPAPKGRKPMATIDVHSRQRPATTRVRARAGKVTTSRARKQTVPYSRSARGAAQGRLQAMVGEIAANINRTIVPDGDTE